VPLIGLSILLSGAASLLILLGQPVWGGVTASASALLQAGAAATGAPSDRSRLLWGAAGPLADAAVLAPVAWMHRESDPGVAALALITLGVCLVASYERARGVALGYRIAPMWSLRLVRQVAVAAGVIAGGAALAATLWIALVLATVSLVSRAAAVATQPARARPAQPEPSPSPETPPAVPSSDAGRA